MEPNASRDALVESHLDVVKTIAAQIRSHLPPHAVSFDELMSAGYVGLLDAASRYDATKNVPFSLYARYRIRGEMIEEVRKFDTSGRVRGLQQLSLDARANEDGDPVQNAAPGPWPEETASIEQTARVLLQLRAKLRPRHQLVIKLLYDEGLSAVRVAELLGVGQGRISQIHSTALAKLRDLMRDRGLTRASLTS